MYVFGDWHGFAEPIGMFPYILELQTYLDELGAFAVWPLDELTGTTAINAISPGTGDATHVSNDLDQINFMDGRAPFFDGSDAYVQLPQAFLESNMLSPDNAAFTQTFGILVNMAEVDLGSTTVYQFFHWGADVSNRFSLFHDGVARRIALFGNVGGTNFTRFIDVPASGYFDKWILCVGILDKAANTAVLRVNDLPAVSGAYSAGTWTATDMAAAYCRLGIVFNGTQDLVGYAALGFMIPAALTSTQYTNLLNMIKRQESAVAV